MRAVDVIGIMFLLLIKKQVKYLSVTKTVRLNIGTLHLLESVTWLINMVLEVHVQD